MTERTGKAEKEQAAPVLFIVREKRNAADIQDAFCYNSRMSKSFKFKSDEALVGKATDIFEKLGLTLDSAVNLFLTQAILKKGLPFPLVISPPIQPTKQ